MKYCPYCGADLVVSAAPFCAECGRALPTDKTSSIARRALPARPTLPSGKRPSIPKGKQCPPAKQKPAGPSPRSSRSGRSFRIPGKPANRQPHSAACKPESDPRDEGYDGYYNDVKTIDNGQTRDRTDPELVKRIILVAAGAFAIVIFAVILMYLL